MNLIEQFKAYTKVFKAANIPKLAAQKGGNMNPRQMQQMMANMGSMMPPAMLKQMGGVGGLQQLMKSMEKMQM